MEVLLLFWLVVLLIAVVSHTPTDTGDFVERYREMVQYVDTAPLYAAIEEGEALKEHLEPYRVARVMMAEMAWRAGDSMAALGYLEGEHDDDYVQAEAHLLRARVLFSSRFELATSLEGRQALTQQALDLLPLGQPSWWASDDDRDVYARALWLQTFIEVKRQEKPNGGLPLEAPAVDAYAGLVNGVAYGETWEDNDDIPAWAVPAAAQALLELRANWLEGGSDGGVCGASGSLACVSRAMSLLEAHPDLVTVLRRQVTVFCHFDAFHLCLSGRQDVCEDAALTLKAGAWWRGEIQRIESSAPKAAMHPGDVARMKSWQTHAINVLARSALAGEGSSSHVAQMALAGSGATREDAARWVLARTEEPVSHRHREFERRVSRYLAATFVGKEAVVAVERAAIDDALGQGMTFDLVVVGIYNTFAKIGSL